MNVFKRLSDIVSANINSALDKMEDPKKMISLMIDEMEETAIEVRSSIAEKTAAQTTLEREIKSKEEAITRWTERAKIAVDKGNDDLAREAIAEKKTLEKQLVSLKSNLEVLKGIIVSLREQLSQVETKLEEIKGKRDELLARAKAAKEKMKTNEVVKNAESSEFARKFEELQARIERWEAEAKVFSEGSSSKVKGTSETFEEMEKNKEIEDELTALKAQTKKEK